MNKDINSPFWGIFCWVCVEVQLRYRHLARKILIKLIKNSITIFNKWVEEFQAFQYIIVKFN